MQYRAGIKRADNFFSEQSVNKSQVMEVNGDRNNRNRSQGTEKEGRLLSHFMDRPKRGCGEKKTRLKKDDREGLFLGLYNCMPWSML